MGSMLWQVGKENNGNHPSICSRTQEPPQKSCVEMAGRRTFRLLASGQLSGT
jgi:hypothetical protein